MKIHFAFRIIHCLLFLIPIQSFSQDVFYPQKIEGEIIFDGMPDETAWQNIRPLDVVMNVPEFGKEPTQGSEIMLAYDEHFIYLAGRLFDSEPEKIQAPSKKRDELGLNNDWFGIIIDSYNDNENALAFFTTPSGLRLDMTVFNDAQGDFPISMSWNTFWDVATVQNEQGWFVEMKIPFSSLRFQDDNGKVKMGIITWRWLARSNELTVFPAIPPDWGFWSVFKPSKAKDAVFENVVKKNPVYVAPYVLGGIQQSHKLNEAETAYEKETEPDIEAGLDLKYSLTSNLTMDLTVNTDFAQVEADNQQVNLTRFSLFFPEKRLFFLERESLFDFNMGGPNKLFHSRTIGIDDGEPVRILGGVRLNGRVGGLDLGLINMQTAKTDSLNTMNHGVVRLKKQVFNPFSYVGAMLTNKIDFKGDYSTVYGLDGVFKIGDLHYLTTRWAQSFNDENKAGSMLDAGRFFAFLEKRTYKGLNYVASFSHSGENFSPEMGFLIRENYTRFGGTLKYGWTDLEKSKILRYSIGLDGFGLKSLESKDWESAELRATVDMLFKSGVYIDCYPGWQFENVPDTFKLSDETEIPSGIYRFYNVTGEISSPGTSLFRVTGNYNLGQFYDGTLYSVSADIGWNISPSFLVSLYYQYNKASFKDRNQSLLAHVSRFNLVYMMNTKLSASAFLQYSNTSNKAITNLRMRYNPREGIDLYFVYNDNLNSDRNREVPILPVSGLRTFLVKFVYTFVL